MDQLADSVESAVPDNSADSWSVAIAVLWRTATILPDSSGPTISVKPELKIETFDVRYVANPNTRSKSGITPFRTFWKVRDHVLSATRAHRPTGPEDGHTPRPSFWLAEDQYNDDLYQIMEIYEANALTREWLADIIAVLKKNKGWAVALGLGDCSLLIYAHKLMVPADKFSDCTTVDSVLEAAQKRIQWTRRHT